AQARAQTAEQRWRNMMEAEIRKIQAQIEVARADTQRRIADAQTKRSAMIAEQQAEVQALIAQTRAQIEMQEARIQQVKLQLDADVLQPAEAARLAAEQEAKAQAAKIIEQGKATAAALKTLAATYRATGGAGREVLLLQKLLPVIERVLQGMEGVKVDELVVLGTAAKETNRIGASLVAANEEIKAALGVDVMKIAQERWFKHASNQESGGQMSSKRGS
ncbi:MAG: hypothetical protein N2515_08035, partial [Deltaproteobacteria bacterium]|nr:hypothetical protein [Deltaproteobacteria bacterium]